jgi:hypothetical protein
MRTTIVSDRIAKEVEESGVEQHLPDDTEIKTWSEFSPEIITADHLVLDLNFVELVEGEEFEDLPLNSIFGGRQRNLTGIDQNAELLLERFEELDWSDAIPNYLDSGSSLTVLYSDMLSIGDAPEGTHTHYWLRKAGLLARTKPIRDASFSDKGVSGYDVVSDSEPVNGYFSYVDGYTHILDFESDNIDEMVEEDPEVLAESSEGNVIAARLSKFRDSSGEVQELEGSVTFLPQPTRLQPRPQDLIQYLAAIGFEGALDDDREFRAYGAAAGSSDLPEIVSEDIENELQKSKHGDEVIKQVKDGDVCVNYELWQPALGSYIHAIEWAFIAYLEAEQGTDIIANEQQGGVYYNLAGGHHDLLDEVTNHVNLDQKTVSSLRSMNQAQRRWMAHHKSGQTLYHDVMSLRSRLGTILEELYT